MTWDHAATSTGQVGPVVVVTLKTTMSDSDSEVGVKVQLRLKKSPNHATRAE